MGSQAGGKIDSSFMSINFPLNILAEAPEEIRLARYDGVDVCCIEVMRQDPVGKAPSLKHAAHVLKSYPHLRWWVGA